MPDVDLTEYAGLFIFVLITIIAVQAYLSYKLHSSKGEFAFFSAALAFLGMLISFGIADAAGFRDASPEIILTIFIGSALLPVLFNIYSLSVWLEQRKQKRNQQKLVTYQNELNELEKKLGYRKTVLGFLPLLKSCGADVSCAEQREELVNAESITREIQLIKEKMQQLS